MSRKHTMERVGITYGGSTHFLLKYSCMKKRYLSPLDVYNTFPGKWDAPYRIKNAYLKMEKRGLVHQKDGKWKITPLGERFLHQVARPLWERTDDDA